MVFPCAWPCHLMYLAAGQCLCYISAIAHTYVLYVPISLSLSVSSIQVCLSRCTLHPAHLYTSLCHLLSPAVPLGLFGLSDSPLLQVCPHFAVTSSTACGRIRFMEFSSITLKKKFFPETVKLVSDMDFPELPSSCPFKLETTPNAGRIVVATRYHHSLATEMALSLVLGVNDICIQLLSFSGTFQPSRQSWKTER